MSIELLKKNGPDMVKITLEMNPIQIEAYLSNSKHLKGAEGWELAKEEIRKMSVETFLSEWDLFDFITVTITPIVKHVEVHEDEVDI